MKIVSPLFVTATTYIISGNISEEDFNKIKSYCINSVDLRETEEITPKSLITRQEEPKEVDNYKQALRIWTKRN